MQEMFPVVGTECCDNVETVNGNRRYVETWRANQRHPKWS